MYILKNESWWQRNEDKITFVMNVIATITVIIGFVILFGVIIYLLHWVLILD
jgi:hypothetical protein